MSVSFYRKIFMIHEIAQSPTPPQIYGKSLIHLICTYPPSWDPNTDRSKKFLQKILKSDIVAPSRVEK